MTQDQNTACAKLKLMIVKDAAALRKIMRHQLKQRGLEKNVLPNGGILPQAIFWLKK